MQVRLRHLDVVPEHAVVADLERANPRACPLAVLHLRDDPLTGSADRSQIVELAIQAVACEPAVAGKRRRIVHERRRDPVADIAEIVQLRNERFHEQRLKIGEDRPHVRDDGERLFEADEIAGTRGAESSACDQALQILHRFARLPELPALGGPRRDLLDRVEPVADRFEADEWAQQPGSQQAAAHDGRRAIELGQQRPVAAAIGSLDDLEMFQRRRIDEQGIGTLAITDRADVREIDLLAVAQIGDQPAGGGGRRRPASETEPFEACGAKLIEQRAPGRFQLERPWLDGRDRERADGRRRQEWMIRRSVVVFRDDDFARAQQGELVGKGLNAVVARVFGGAELTGREVEQGDADGRLQLTGPVARMRVPRHQRHQKRRLARIEIVAVGERPGRHDANDLPFDDTLRLARVFDLLANRDAEPFFHQARDVGIDGVERHAAHRNAAAVGVFRS